MIASMLYGLQWVHIVYSCLKYVSAQSSGRFFFVFRWHSIIAKFIWVCYIEIEYSCSIYHLRNDIQKMRDWLINNFCTMEYTRRVQKLTTIVESLRFLYKCLLCSLILRLILLYIRIYQKVRLDHFQNPGLFCMRQIIALSTVIELNDHLQSIFWKIGYLVRTDNRMLHFDFNVTIINNRTYREFFLDKVSQMNTKKSEKQSPWAYT